MDFSRTDIDPAVCKTLFQYIQENKFPGLKTVDISGNMELDDEVLENFYLPVTTRDFSFFYHETSVSPWILVDILCHHEPGTFSCVSAMSASDSIPQIVIVLYVVVPSSLLAHG